MKKKNVLNLLVMALSLVFVAFTVLFLRHYGIGGSLNTLGIIFTIGSVLIFVFFLSIDPGYGWVKSTNYTTVYIVMSISVLICIVGVILMALGSGIHEERVKEIAAENRCKAFQEGNAAMVMADDWFYLVDKKTFDDITAYFFRKRGDVALFKIVAVVNQGKVNVVNELEVFSDFLVQPVTITSAECLCPGVFEREFSVSYAKKEQLGSGAQFTLTAKGSGEAAGAIVTLKCDLLNEAVEKSSSFSSREVLTGEAASGQ